MATTLLPHEDTGSEWDQYVWRADRPIRASLIRRLAEAADGIRNNKPIYFVAQLIPDEETGHDVLGYFKSAKDAFEHSTARALLDSGNYLIFGPYQTDDDQDYRRKPIREIILVPENARSVLLNGTKFDCIFWSLSAIDKFVVPYYVAIGDLKRAQKIREDFKKETSIAGIHIPGSDIVNDPDNAMSTTITEQGLQDRVGLYQMKSAGSHGNPEIVFIPL